MTMKKPFSALYTLRLLGAVMLLTLVGCSGPTPSLKSLNYREAKVEVWPDGRMLVHGKPAKIESLAEIIKGSSTQPNDPIFIRLNDDVDSLEMQNIRHRINDQMVRCGHYKYAYFSAPQASVSTLDKKTGNYTTVKQSGLVHATSGEEMHREIDRMAAEAKAYEEGSYVSNALNLNAQQQDVIIESEAEALKHRAEDLSAEELQRLSVRQGAPVVLENGRKVELKSTLIVDQPPTEEDLRKAYQRQQRRQKNPKPGVFENGRKPANTTF
jgi:hypothetical protein